MSCSGAGGLAERFVRHPLVRLAAACLTVWLAFMFHVRGVPVAPPPDPAQLPELIARMASGSPTILSQAELERLAAVASGLTVQEGRRPGPFHVLYLERLDTLEKFHHLMHQPFTGIRRMYCDVWIHSVTTYGTPEATWGLGRVVVSPALKLPIFLFLLDRLGRENTAFGEYTGAVFEAFRGMEMHTVEGRARLWERVFTACLRQPVLADWAAEQLALENPAWTDDAELDYWRAQGPDRVTAFRQGLALRRARAPAAPPRSTPPAPGR